MSLVRCRMALLGCGKTMLWLWSYATPKGSPRSTGGRCVKWSFTTILKTARRFHRIDECRWTRENHCRVAARARYWAAEPRDAEGGHGAKRWRAPIRAMPKGRGRWDTGAISWPLWNAIGGAAMLWNLVRSEKTRETAQARGPQLDRLCRAVKSLSTADAGRF